MLNCKIGDLAVIVNVGTPRLAVNLGRLVEVVGLSSLGIGFWECESVGSPIPASIGRNYPLVTKDGILTCADANLRPIRDNDSEDSKCESHSKTAPPLPMKTSELSNVESIG